MTRDNQKLFSLGIDQKYKRGILFTDDMESDTPYEISGTGTDYSVVNTTAAKYFGVQGLRLTTKATTPAAGDYVQIAKTVIYPESGKLVVRLRLGIPDVSKVKEFHIYTQVFNGTRRYDMGVEYEPNVPQFNYGSSGGLWTNITGYGQTITDGFWSIIEVAVNMVDWMYIYAMLNGIKTDLSDKAMQNAAATTERKVQINIKTTAVGAAQSRIDLDSLYVGEFERL